MTVLSFDLAEGEHKLCHQQGLEWSAESVFFRRVMLFKKMSQVRSERSADRFVSAVSKLSPAMFGLVRCRSEQKTNFIFRDQDLESQDGHGWKVEITTEQRCAICLLLASLSSDDYR